MALLASRCYSRALFGRLLTRSSLFAQVPDRDIAVQSKQFPGYVVLYDFPQIKNASRINGAKRNVTVFYGCLMPILIAFRPQLDCYFIPEIFDSFSFIGGAIVVFLHSIGFVLNNTIGYIYLKDDQQSMKISYVGYWGNRINKDTTIDDISILNINSRKEPLYRKLQLSDSKQTLKLFLNSGRILDVGLFDNVFRKVHT